MNNYQKLGAPYGDIYYVNTPNIDRVGAMMINDEKQRQRAQQLQAQDLDKEFAKNVSAIRDADVPEAVEKWGKYKQASIDLYKNENKLSNEERVAKQLEKQRLFADYMAHTNKSKLDKSDEEVALADWKKNTGNFNDDAHNFLLERRKTPLSKMQVTLPMLDKKTGKLAVMDMSDIYGNILYRNGTTDFTPTIQKAIGKHELRGKPVNVISPGGLTTTTTQYKGLQSPNTIIGNLFNSVVGSKKTKDFPLENNYTDDQANDIIIKYQALKQTPEFKNAYPNEPDIPATLFQSSLGKAIALKAMESHVLNPPVAVVSKPFNNTEAMNKLKEDAATLAFERKKQLAAFNDKLIKGRKEDGTVDINQVGYPLDLISQNYGVDNNITSAEGYPFGTVRKVKESDIPVGALNQYNPIDKNHSREVYPLEDEGTGENYYNAIKNTDGHWELVGKGGKKIGADESRNRFIKENVGSNFKLKTTMNKPGANTSTKNSTSSGKKKYNPKTGKFE